MMWLCGFVVVALLCGVALRVYRGGFIVWCGFVGLSWWYISVMWLGVFIVVVYLCSVALRVCRCAIIV